MTDGTLIIRANHDADNPYFMLLRETAQNDQLTWEALGMLTYLLSKPNDWQTRVSDLKRRAGREKTARIMGELQEHGYLTKKVRRAEKGLIGGWDWQVHELPTEIRLSRSTAEPHDGEPGPIHKKERKQNKESRSSANAGERTFNKEHLDILLDQMSIWLFEARSNDRASINANIPRAGVLLSGPKPPKKRPEGAIYLLEFERQHQELEDIHDLDLVTLSKAPRLFAAWWRQTHPKADLPINQDGTFIGRWAEWRNLNKPKEGTAQVYDEETGVMMSEAAIALRSRQRAEVEARLAAERGVSNKPTSN